MPFFLNWSWLVCILLFAPAVTVFGVVFMVLVSAKSKSYIEAVQTSGYIILPLVLMFIGEFCRTVFTGCVPPSPDFGRCNCFGHCHLVGNGAFVSGGEASALKRKILVERESQCDGSRSSLPYLRVGRLRHSRRSCSDGETARTFCCSRNRPRHVCKA